MELTSKTRNNIILIIVAIVCIVAFGWLNITQASALQINNSLNNSSDKLDDSLPKTNKLTINEKTLSHRDLTGNNSYQNMLLPSSYDQRDDNLVTPVKFQNPFGTCWCFANISAAETSILSSKITGLDKNTLDLSELMNSYFGYQHIPGVGEQGYDPENSQAGEGEYTASQKATDILNIGGFNRSFLNSVLAGNGPIYENSLPYQPRNKLVRAYKDGDRRNFVDNYTYEQAIQNGYRPFCYSDEDDWSVSGDNRNCSEFILSKYYYLPKIQPNYDSLTDTYSLNTDGMNAVKNALINGNGIAVSFMADSASQNRNKQITEGKYITTGWNHFTWASTPGESVSCDHEVAIVGWDDNYAADNFKITNPVKWDSNGRCVKTLPVNAGELTNNEQGFPTYTKEISVEADKTFVFDPNNEYDKLLLDDTGKTDLSGNKIYKFKDNVGELTNTPSGGTYYPGTQEKMPDERFCDNVHETGTHVPSGNGAWICKNSWGANNRDFPYHTDWGNDGYFYISYYDMSIAETSTLNFLNKSDFANETTYNYSHIFQNQDIEPDFVWPETFSCMSNVFTAKQNQEITNVGCETNFAQTNANIKVYLLNDNYSTPEDGTLVAQLNQSFDFVGYYRIALDQPVAVNAGQKFSVVVQLSHNVDATTKNYVNPRKSWSDKSPLYEDAKFCSVSVVNKGESFYFDSATNSWNDWADWASDYCAKNPEIVLDNMCVFAYANPIADPGPEVVSATGATGDSVPITAVVVLVGVVAACAVVFTRKKFN